MTEPAPQDLDKNYARVNALIDSKDFEGAWRILRPYVERKEPVALNLMGVIHELSGATDLSQSFFKEAAASGNGNAAANLAFEKIENLKTIRTYGRDSSVGTSLGDQPSSVILNEAVSFLEMAYVSGIPLMDYHLGNLYLLKQDIMATQMPDHITGPGIMVNIGPNDLQDSNFPNPEKAEMWFRKSAEVGYPRSHLQLAILLADKEDFRGALEHMSHAINALGENELPSDIDAYLGPLHRILKDEVIRLGGQSPTLRAYLESLMRASESSAPLPSAEKSPLGPFPA